MSDFLSTMIASSRRRLRQAEQRESLNELRLRALAQPEPPALALHPSCFDLIAEVKLCSPSTGRFVSTTTDGVEAAARRARLYERAGAAAISVLSEPSAFAGTLHHVAAAAWACSIPVMRKDFLIDPYQIYEARAAGAGGVLVIVRILTDDTVQAMFEAAAETGMFVLVEAFDAADLERTSALISGRPRGTVPLLVGLNTRNLADLRVDPSRLAALAGQLPSDANVPSQTLRVAESGISCAEDARGAARLGYDLALVGSALMRSEDPGALIRSLLEAGRAGRTRACG